MQAWICIDIFAAKYTYRLRGQPETFTNQIFSRLFQILTEKDFSIHQAKFIKNWDSIQKDLVGIKEDEEGESEKETDCSNIDCK